MVIPGQACLPISNISANATPDGGQVGRLLALSNVRKYPRQAEA
jgi:hypothetical protein